MLCFAHGKIRMHPRRCHGSRGGHRRLRCRPDRSALFERCPPRCRPADEGCHIPRHRRRGLVQPRHDDVLGLFVVHARIVQGNQGQTTSRIARLRFFRLAADAERLRDSRILRVPRQPLPRVGQGALRHGNVLAQPAREHHLRIQRTAVADARPWQGKRPAPQERRPFAKRCCGKYSWRVPAKWSMPSRSSILSWDRARRASHAWERGRDSSAWISTPSMSRKRNRESGRRGGSCSSSS